MATEHTVRLLSPATVADRWEWHQESVRRSVRAGRIAAIRISGRIRIPLTEIERIESTGKIIRSSKYANAEGGEQ
jgi:hypothetical protein